MNRIERVEYLSKLKKFRDKKLIKVVTGIRRCGKSTLMEIYRDWLISQRGKQRAHRLHQF